MEKFDADGLPVTPDHATHYRGLSHAAAQTAPRPAQYYNTPIRELTMKDVAAYEAHETNRDLLYIARLAHRRDSLKARIERVMETNYHGYVESGLPAAYATITGAEAEAKRSSR